MKSEIETILCECWDRSLECFGTAWIFEQRADRLTLKLSLLTYVSVAIPIIIGTLVGAFGRDVISAQLLVWAGVLGLLQVVTSLWAIVDGWVGKQATATQAMSNNYRFSDRYHDLAKRPPDVVTELRRQFDLTDAEEKGYSGSDMQQGISDPERRAGMRAALRQFGRPCDGCHITPTDMSATACGICGNFSISWLQLKNKRVS